MGIQDVRRHNRTDQNLSVSFSDQRTGKMKLGYVTSPTQTTMRVGVSGRCVVGRAFATKE